MEVFRRSAYKKDFDKRWRTVYGFQVKMARGNTIQLQEPDGSNSR
jgi:hypothetical protein